DRPPLRPPGGRQLPARRLAPRRARARTGRGRWVDAGTETRKAARRPAAASVLQAPGFRSDVTVFRLNAMAVDESGSEPAFCLNTAEPVYIAEAAHNPEVAGSNPAPATG